MQIAGAPPSVFISSTVKEFRDLRSAIAYTLRTQGFTVYQSEASDFDIHGDRSAIQECLANIHDRDFYILLVGNTRGNLFEEGISITRKEYRTARDDFLSTGRPRLFLYLRDRTEIELQGSRKVQSAVGIDDPSHLASFINEIQEPGMEGAPNYLTRFRDFEHLMESLEIRMNLGRNLAEKIIRHSLLSELLSNLSKMVHRSGTSAYARHRYMAKTRSDIPITPDDLSHNTSITEKQMISLALSLTHRTRGEDLKTRSIEDALDRGVFITFNSANGAPQESTLHKTLRQTLEDIKDLHRLDRPSDQYSWDIKILAAISARRRGPLASLEIVGWDLATAFRHYDLMENMFQGHVALCQVLLGLSEEFPSYHRRPITPLGEQEQQKLHAEAASGIEISRLIQNNIWPFGNRVPRELYGKTRADQVEKIANNMDRILTNLGIEEQHKDISKRAAEDYLDMDTPLPEEGIENLGTR